MADDQDHGNGGGENAPVAPPAQRRSIGQRVRECFACSRGNPAQAPNNGPGQANPQSPSQPSSGTATSANRGLPLKGFQCFSQWWFMLVLFATSVTFYFVQPKWYEFQSRFVQREYILTCVSRETKFTGKDVNKFVKILHTIITDEGCYSNLDPYNMVVEFNEDRPIIPKDIILDDLRRTEKYTYQLANELIDLCEKLFNESYRDVVIPYGNGFIYMNDSLLKSCGYHVFEYVGDIVIFVLLLIVFGSLHLSTKCFINNYSKEDTVCRTFCGIAKDDEDNPGCFPCCSSCCSCCGSG